MTPNPALKESRGVSGKKLEPLLKPRLFRWFKKARVYGKIDGAIALQEICRRTNVPFDQFRVYEPREPVDIGWIKGAERILVRSKDDRKEYVLAGKNSREINEVLRSIRRGNNSQRIIIQKVGLREHISSYGQIKIEVNPITGQIRISYGEKTQSPASIKNKGVFVAPVKKSLSSMASKLGKGEKLQINDMLGHPNAAEMIREVAHEICRDGKVARVRYVRYLPRGNKGSEPYFYDLISINRFMV
ncbi:MAG: hypothetical protein ABIH20_04010 [Candidatus Diapherotrites archaeon]